MRITRIGTLFLIAVPGVLYLTSCSGPSAPQPGTPRFFWAAANETWAAGDYMKTEEHLSKLVNSQNDYRAKAQPWFLILTSGMTKAYMDLAEYSEFGGRAKPPLAIGFRRNTSNFRTYASRLSLQFAEEFEAFEKLNKDKTIPLAFSFPMGNPTMSAQIQRMGQGNLPNAAALDEIVSQHLKTGVVQATCRAVGATDDIAKAQGIFKAGNVQAPRETFFLSMANALHQQAQMYDRMKLDQPDRMKMFSTHALDIIKGLPETKETADLSKKIQKTLKLVSTK
jgi:hypothetical protein